MKKELKELLEFTDDCKYKLLTEVRLDTEDFVPEYILVIKKEGTDETFEMPISSVLAYLIALGTRENIVTQFIKKHEPEWEEEDEDEDEIEEPEHDYDELMPDRPDTIYRK